MIALLKRRWILLSCTVVLALGFCINAVYVSNPLSAGPLGGSTWRCAFGVRAASFLFVYAHTPNSALFPTLTWKRLQVFGRWGFRVDARENSVRVPVWFPICSLFGWIVWRELRWREKRARKAATP